LVVEPESEGERDALSPGIEKKEAPDDAPLILIVEDNLELATYISGILDDQYRILTAENGKIGLNEAIEKIPDLVISDLMMPVMDGLELCGKIKEDRRTNHIPVILLTARADRESKLEGLGTGADDYIIKPFDSEELKTRIRNLILQREKLREHFRQDFLLEDNGQVVPASFSSLKEIVSIIDRHLEDPDFHIRAFSEALSMSRSQLFRKIENITGTTPNELIRLVRMKRAAQLLRTGVLNVTQVMYQVGMTHPSHFASSFRKYYGVNPSEYKNHRG
jgi:DNA-binding response OmpR family regulator